VRFTSVQLTNWRNFRSVEIELAQRAFVVGPNASGKSNFLDAFRFLRDVAAIGGGLQDAAEKRGGVTRIRSLSARKDPQIGLSVTLGDDQDARLWTYELRFGREPHGAHRRPVVKLERVRRGSEILLNRPDHADDEDPERLTQTALEQVTANKEFRQVFEFFSSVQYLHIVPQLIREPDRSAGRTNDPFGGDFLERVGSTPKRTRDARLRRIRNVLQVAVPQLDQLVLETDERGAWHIRGRYQHWRPQGAWQDESDFSDGTLRLIGLLWSLLDRGGTLLLEEPELSLHPEIVRTIPQMFAKVQQEGGRQVLVSTHASDLFYDTGIGLDEIVLLTPANEGTDVRTAARVQEIVMLLRTRQPLAEVVVPYTRPRGVEQIPLFLDA
jgi:predicted ATPase